MFNLLKLNLLLPIMLLLIATQFSFAAPPMSGTYNVGGGQTYTSLTGSGSSGFFNAVNTNGLNGDITVYITSNITESGSVSLSQWSGGYTITIRPSSGVEYILTGTSGAPTFTLNGADNLIIDGRFNGSGRFLRFRNTSTSGSVFRFVNDATNNTITYCKIEGMRVSNTEGIINFSTTNGSTGNDNNTISNCLISDATTGNFQNAIVSNGTTSPVAEQNSNNNIIDNEIINVWRNAASCSGILLLGGSRDWTISGNSFYQTATRTPTSGTIWNMIHVNTSSAVGLTITNNSIGGSAANCGGSPWTVSGNQMNSMYLIRFSTAGTSSASNVDGNTIANIDFTSRPTSSGSLYFVGILVQSGYVNIGTNSGNTIGSSISTGNIVLNMDGTTTNIINRGIDHRGRGDVSNNIIGGIETAGNNNQMVRLECLHYSGNPSITTTISNNTIGSTTVANSIAQTSNSFIFQLTGIHSQITTQTVNITGNTVSNLVETNTNSSSRIRGIYQNRSTTSPLNVSNNTISNLYCASSSTDRYPDNTSLIGLFSGSSSATQLISGNTITGLYGTGNSDSYVMGFGFYNNLAKGTFENNKISNLNHSSNTGAPKVWAINAFWGAWNFYNNQISITNGEPADNSPVIPTTGKNRNMDLIQTHASLITEDVLNSLVKDLPVQGLNDAEKQRSNQLDAMTNGVEIKGIHDEAEFPCVYYYNSVYIGGNAASGNPISWAYDRPLLAWATPATLRNNIFFNARTGGTGKHYAIGNEVGAANWLNTSADYNLYISSNINTIATWGVSDQTIQQWRVSSTGDKHTWSTTSSAINASNLFTDISTGNLKINASNWEAWIVSGKGLAIAGQTADAEGNLRPSVISSGCSDIGADEFAATPPSNPLATFDFAPGSGVTSTYSLWGRTLATIEWGTGGSYPSALNVQYYSGANPPNVLGGGYSNSYWSMNPVGTFSGTTYDVTIHFGENETYTISSPSLNTRLAKHNGTWEVFSTSGTGTWQSELNWASETVKSRGMTGFSDYALTDGTDPLPVEICSFDAFLNNRDVDLSWSTCTEVNNKGFDIERRVFNSLNNEFSSWVKTGYIDGNGTTNEPQYYRFSDKKLSTGKYQYRLKQIDFNGNFEYHNLNNPSDVIIGTPGNADLFQNYPNPSNPSSKVDFQLPFAGRVTLKVFDITGKEVAVLVDKDLDGGFYTAEFNGSNLASGVYFYRLAAQSNEGNSFTKTMKLILVK